MEEEKTVLVKINVPLLREQRDVLNDLNWTSENIHHLYGLTNMMDAMLDLAELGREQPEFKIIGFDKEQTETYKKNISKVTKDMSFVDEEGNTHK